MRSEARRRFTKRVWFNFLAGAVVGGAGMTAAIELGPSLELVEPHLPGLFIAGLLSAMALYILGASTRAAWTAKVMGTELEPDDDLDSERLSLRWQGLVSLLAGIELLILCFGTDLLRGENGPLLFVLLLAVLAVQTWFNLLLWRRGDEFFRRLIVETGVAAFIVFQFLLFFWAAGERFGYIEDPTALDVYVLVMAVYLGTSGVVAFRRGYGVPA